jgi:hypothetical protein
LSLIHDGIAADSNDFGTQYNAPVTFHAIAAL